MYKVLATEYAPFRRLHSAVTTFPLKEEGALLLLPLLHDWNEHVLRSKITDVSLSVWARFPYIVPRPREEKKMAAKTKTEGNLQKLFKELKLCGDDGDYEGALEVAEEILKAAHDDSDANLCKLVCLIQLSRFQDALKFIEQATKRKGTPQYLFEKAYCLYRQEKYSQSVRILDQIPSDSRENSRVNDLRAQIHYRIEDYRRSAEMFRSGLSGDQSQERQANFTAALSYCEPDVIRSMLAVTPVARETMEQCFNLATAYLAASQDAEMWKKAETLLREAEELCSKSLEDDPDATEEDLEMELVPVRVQIAYAKQLQGRGEEAMALYNTVLKQKPSNPTHSVTAANNIIVLNRDKDIFDSKRKLKMLANDQAMRKLNSLQQLVVNFNRCQFALHTNQMEQCRQLLAFMKKRYPTEDLTALAEAAVLFRQRKVSESVSVLEGHINSNPAASIDLHLTLAQIIASQNNAAKARQVLEGIPDLPQSLGVVSTLVSQFTSVGDIDGAVRVLDSTFQWWKEKGVNSGATQQEMRKKVLWEILQYKLRHNRPQETVVILELLREEEPTNVKYLATLISAYSRFDLKKAEELGRSLPRFTLSTSVDVDSLEQMPSFRHARRHVVKADPPSQEGENKGESDAPAKEKKRKKRKSRLPKNFDPSKQPDPERWLPLRERSYYRRGKKKGHASAVGRGTQGTSAATASLTAQLDASKPKSTPSASQEGGGGGSDVSSPKAKPHPQRKQQQKKKKKGGRR